MLSRNGLESSVLTDLVQQLLCLVSCVAGATSSGSCAVYAVHCFLWLAHQSLVKGATVQQGELLVVHVLRTALMSASVGRHPPAWPDTISAS